MSRGDPWATAPTPPKALRPVSLCSWRMGALAAAALVLLHHGHGRAT
jgi:hypothetical protein